MHIELTSPPFSRLRKAIALAIAAPSGVGLLLALAAALAPTPAAAIVFSEGTEAGIVADGAINEASGIVASRTNPDVLWVHNDSGESARIFAISLDGKLLAQYLLVGAEARDYEDIAIGPGDTTGKHHLYLADIGDNMAKLPSIRVYRVPEPDTTNATGEIELEGTRAIELRYPDGPHDAEALMSDPLTGDLFVITKDVGGDNGVYRAPFPHDLHETTTLRKVATVRFPGEGPSDLAATGADISLSGELILIRSYNRALIWERKDAQSIASALTGTPTEVRVPGPPEEPQGEAIAFSPDGKSYYTIGEGVAQALVRYDRIGD